VQSPSQHIGKKYEDVAVSYLQQKGFIIIAQNYRYKKAEIDIIAQKDACLCFVEVKARASHRFGYAGAFVTPYKQQLIKTAAENYILQHNWNDSIRFDIIAVLYQKGCVEHFEDAFL
jgi:putative endonuclease